MEDENIAGLPLHRLSELIRNRDVSSRQLVETYLKRIAKIGGRDGINAYINIAEKDALNKAGELDKLAKQGKFKGLLHGLPIALKDNINTRRIPTTCGTRFLSTWRPDKDAYLVRKIMKAGGIILGKTNMHEFAFGVTNNNPHFGPTRNPYDMSRIPGGSSGGSAAATAASLCVAAIGTDTGGSVRIPAALCGVVGLKPTLGRVGRGGVMGLSFSRDAVGPITRTVTDSAILLEVISGKDPGDPESASRKTSRYSAFLKKNLNGEDFCIPKDFFFDIIESDTEGVFKDAISEIKKLGGQIKEVKLTGMEYMSHAMNIVTAECVNLIEDYLKEFDPDATIEKYLDQLGADVRSILGSEKGLPESKPVPGYIYIRSVRDYRNRLISAFKEALSGSDAMLIPTTPLPASKISDGEEIELEGKKLSALRTFTRNCNPFNVIGFPAITVPAGYSRNGLPIGLQIVTRPWTERKLLSIAYAFEQATKVWHAPKL
jgi:aspartyl-tRNA(Asn)/glutamyl-tRNA(Gln) amidotransferase subunit A